MVWFTSDLHVRHKLVARERFARARRDFTPAFYVSDAEYDDMAVEWHDSELARQWDSRVASDDTVIVVGDVTAGSSKDQRHFLDEWLPNRPGNVILVPGNHDGVHGSNRDADKWFQPYAARFKAISPFLRRRIVGKNVMMSHFPYDGDGEHSKAERYTQYRLADEGLPLIHGHTHSESRVSRSKRGTLQIHVGVDAWGMAPVPLREIEQMVEADNSMG